MAALKEESPLDVRAFIIDADLVNRLPRRTQALYRKPDESPYDTEHNGKILANDEPRICHIA